MEYEIDGPAQRMKPSKMSKTKILLVLVTLSIVAILGLTIGLMRRRRSRPKYSQACGKASFSSSESSNGPWPSCVGQTGECCKEHILAFDGSLEGSIYILPDGSTVTMDYDTKRVRIYVDGNGIVVRSPNRG